MSEKSSLSERMFGEEGLFKKSWPHFEVRPSQSEMLAAVSQAFEEEKIALIEAGTGTGKTIAYLIPAILCAIQKKETIVLSTHTIALQNQLLTKDIPALLSILKQSCEVVLVKGMHHYLCLKKWKR